MQPKFTARTVFHALSPVGCAVEALSIALLFTAMLGCAVAALP